MKTEVPIIRYNNRKYYLPAVTEDVKGRYINLSDIEDFVKLGRAVKVRTYPGDLDVTGPTLIQILKRQKARQLEAVSETQLLEMVRQ